MDVYYDNGLFVKISDKKLLFDPDANVPFDDDVNYVFITHPHTDHFSGIHKYNHAKKIMNRLCYDIITDCFNKQLDNVIFCDSPNYVLNDLKISVYQSNHIFGAVQYEIRYDGKSFGYTGDLCFESRLGIGNSEIMKHCDVLVIDSTFGSRDFVFPTRKEIYKRILMWIQDTLSNGAVPCISARPLGTTQELIKLINLSSIGAEIGLSPMSYKVTGICKKYNYTGEFKLKVQPDCSNNNGKMVFIKPFGQLNTLKSSEAVCSGWTIKMNQNNVFPLSNHSDFKQIIEYVKLSNPKQVYTVFCGNNDIADSLTQLGFDAKKL